MMGPIHKILVLIDGTEQSITAAQFSICLAHSSGAELTALYVVNKRALDDLLKSRIFLQEEQSEYQHDLETDAERYLNHVQKMAQDKGVDIETISKSGTVHREVIESIKAGDYDLLVMGEISRIRSRRDEFYNEAERTMRLSPCSVLVVKDEEKVFEMFERWDD
ncbi:MAG: universal stress protein [Chitinivibrionales bacterium]|nr:universal stress protein [Chitinivibrionales bacterium]